ncbi:hypothetical protein HID58_056322 [Brassica napus]|uniref:Arabidopsis retrotransposon Orf1 C-terminal domain-containing protein n=1 Tax=Brassica napus TaxID=3708 RepID=A0ABQ8ANB1_BRANA|nr:hypothetical protein HID58_056322 [Brassica napus]
MERDIMPKRQKKQSERGDSSVQTARLSTKGKFRKTDRSHPANREITQQWDIHDDDFYEQMRGVEICPSRFAHRDTTDALGITEDIEALFEKIGLGYIFDLHCDCYADLTRQFLASARLYHPDEDNPVADKAMFSFIVNRQFHSMTIFQLCDVFGFGKGRQSCVPDFPEHNDFWTFIASGNFISREAKQARIRSPRPDSKLGVLLAGCSAVAGGSDMRAKADLRSLEPEVVPADVGPKRSLKVRVGLFGVSPRVSGATGCGIEIWQEAEEPELVRFRSTA